MQFITIVAVGSITDSIPDILAQYSTQSTTAENKGGCLTAGKVYKKRGRKNIGNCEGTVHADTKRLCLSSLPPRPTPSPTPPPTSLLKVRFQPLEGNQKLPEEQNKNIIYIFVPEVGTRFFLAICPFQKCTLCYRGTEGHKLGHTRPQRTNTARSH